MTESKHKALARKYLRQLSKQKKQLEMDIAAATAKHIKSFEEETGVQVSDVNIMSMTQHTIGGSPQEVLVDCGVTLELGEY